ncbi:hypothetical protein [Patulibacter minatonensis]|uniref:hypothetical protein n=1 Tax=Patulibacter minatonensis TaxID=298163 RepID=UPI00047E6632|nr:hypothetical protein [Patulibacter minatonensis]
MRRRTTTQVVVLCGGGPADGESREVEDGTSTLVVHDGPVEPVDDDAVTTAHLYVLRADGRFHHDGVFVVDDAPELPAATHEDPRAMGLAALGHDTYPSWTAILSMCVFIVVVMAFYYEYTH